MFGHARLWKNKILHNITFVKLDELIKLGKDLNVSSSLLADPFTTRPFYPYKLSSSSYLPIVLLQNGPQTTEEYNLLFKDFYKSLILLEI